MAQGMVKINVGRCKGCGLCVSFCPKKVLELDTATLNEKGYHPAAVMHPEDCIGCAMCAMMCPDVVITVERGEGK